MDQGIDPPEALWPPDVLHHDWLEAFWECSTDRQMLVLSKMERVVVKATAIPAQSIRDASRDMTPEEAEMFRVCIRAMDRVFLRHHNGAYDPEPTMTARDSFRAAFKK